jgi:hypothetical protein
MVTPKVAQVISQHLLKARVKKILRELDTPRRRGPVPFGGLPGEAATVEKIRELRSSKMSLQDIADALNADLEHYPTRSLAEARKPGAKPDARPGAMWSKMTIKLILDRAV